MNQEQQSNQPAGMPQYQPAGNPPPRRSNTWIYLGIIALLLVTNVYLFLNRNKLSDQNTILSQQKVSADSSYLAVDTDYKAALLRLDELSSRNASLDSTINGRDSEIARLRAEIKKILQNKNRTASDLGRARRLINELNVRIEGYEAQIATLKTEVQAKTQENQVLARERDSSVMASEQLRRIGSVLHASSIRFEPIDLRRGGAKEKETAKAKRVDLIRIYFDIDENRIAKSGTKDLFVRIVNPDGQLVSNASLGSGITTAADGASVGYTMLKQVQLQQAQPLRDITLDWQAEEYKKGDYTVELYHEGYKIGQGKVALK